MAILACVFVWLLLAVVAAMRFSRPRKFSDTERQRLVEQGDTAAQAEAEYEALRPLLSSLQYVARTLIGVLFVIVAVLNFGVVAGAFIGLVGLLAVPLVFRVSFFCRMADKLRDRLQPSLETAVRSLAPALRWLRERDLVSSDTILHSQTELVDLIKRSPGVLTRDELERLEASLAFDAKTVEEIMTPRSMISAIASTDHLGPLAMDELYKTGHSRFPVYKKDLDHIIGMVYLHDLLDLKTEHSTAEKMMQKDVYFVRQDRSLAHVLHGFLSKRHHLFVVVNEYRETVGLISLEDTMEALIGKKIVDEFDAFDDLRAVAAADPHHNNHPEGEQNI